MSRLWPVRDKNDQPGTMPLKNSASKNHALSDKGFYRVGYLAEESVE